MTVIFTDQHIAGSILHKNGDRYLVRIPGSGARYGYIHESALCGVIHSRIITKQEIFIAHSSALEPIEGRYVGDGLALFIAEGQGIPTMLTIEIEPDSYLWLYAEIYNNAGDPYYLSALNETGTLFIYTGPELEKLAPLIAENRWCISARLELNNTET